MTSDSIRNISLLHVSNAHICASNSSEPSEPVTVGTNKVNMKGVCVKLTGGQCECNSCAPIYTSDCTHGR